MSHVLASGTLHGVIAPGPERVPAWREQMQEMTDRDITTYYSWAEIPHRFSKLYHSCTQETPPCQGAGQVRYAVLWVSGYPLLQAADRHYYVLGVVVESGKRARAEAWETMAQGRDAMHI